MNFSLKPNFKAAGPVLGAKVKAFGAALAKADAKAVVAEIEAKGEIVLELNGEATSISRDLVDVMISAKEGFVVSMENNLFTILDTTITQELIDEGIAREFISKIQQMRKAHDFEMMDNIEIVYTSDEEVEKAVAAYKEYIMNETLAVSLTVGEGEEKVNLNGHDASIMVKRV